MEQYKTRRQKVEPVRYNRSNEDLKTYKLASKTGRQNVQPIRYIYCWRERSTLELSFWNEIESMNSNSATMH